MTLVLAVMLALPVAVAPRTASAGFFDFLFGGGEPARGSAPLANAFADPSATPSSAPSVATGGGRYAAYCVRTCDGRYFPMTARGTTAVQMCQSFCPASPTKVFSGGNIDHAVTTAGERYPDMANAYAYRKALKADCTCNGRDPAGLAPVDLSLDSTLRPGDVVATTNGLVAYTGVRTGNSQIAEFTPVNNYPGLNADVRARLGDMKVAPVNANIREDSEAAAPDITGSLGEAALPPQASVAPKNITPKAKRADAH